MPESKPPPPETQAEAGEVAPLAAEDFYYDGPYLVFTAAYHRRRGFCCGSHCRHCPYGDSDDSTAAKRD